MGHRLEMRYVESPEWARAVEVEFFEGFKLSDYEAFQSERERVMGFVQKKVQEYIDDEQLVSEEAEDFFPLLNQLSGEYYVDSEMYSIQNLKGVFSLNVFVMTHCLNREGRDYLGLEVCLNAKDAKSEFLDMGTGPSSI